MVTRGLYVVVSGDASRRQEELLCSTYVSSSSPVSRSTTNQLTAEIKAPDNSAKLLGPTSNALLRHWQYLTTALCEEIFRSWAFVNPESLPAVVDFLGKEWYGTQLEGREN
jgi:hypothetical protein